MLSQYETQDKKGSNQRKLLREGRALKTADKEPDWKVSEHVVGTRGKTMGRRRQEAQGQKVRGEGEHGGHTEANPGDQVFRDLGCIPAADRPLASYREKATQLL